MTLSDDERGRLETERDFLLRSLDDLDRERDDDGIDVETYAVLHADYTARAALATRRLTGHERAESVDASETAGERRDPRWGLTALAIGIIALTVTLGVVMFAAPRDPGDSLTGNQDIGERSSDSSTTPTPTSMSPGELDAEYERLAAAVEASPDDFDARMDLGLFWFQQRNYIEATRALAVASQLRPDDVEAQSFYGWATWQLSQQAPDGEGREELVEISLEHLQIAVELDPDDASANTFYGIALLRGSGDAAGAISYLERAVELAGDQAPPMLAAALEEARTTVAASTSSALAAPTTTEG